MLDLQGDGVLRLIFDSKELPLVLVKIEEFWDPQILVILGTNTSPF
jgi:hypothetical protein